MNRATFLVGYPELASADVTLIDAKLAEAELNVDAEAFGDRYDQAHGLLTAHYIACSPGGVCARLEADKLETTYGRAFASLRDAAATAIRVF